MTVYIVESHQEAKWIDTRPWRDALGRGIAVLAKQTNTKIWFHGYEDRIDNTPFLMVECSEDFYKKMLHLTGVVAVREAPAGIKTVRSKNLDAYFLNAPKAPSGLKPR